MSVSIAIGEEMLTRLREAIIHQYPVNTETLATNYQKLFREIINPQEFGCQNFLLFVYKIQLEHGIWETNKTNNQTLVKPSKVVYSKKYYLSSGAKTLLIFSFYVS